MKHLWIATLALLAACGQQPQPARNAADGHDDAHAHAAPANEHSNMSHRGHGTPAAPKPGEPTPPEIVDEDFRWDDLKAPATARETVDLKNELDPVTLKPAGDVTLEYKGYRVRFESDSTRDKFQRKPIKYLSMLSLEPSVAGSVTLVDASAYQDAVTDFCPYMPDSEVDPHGTVYLLHRGWKFYFCCWTGCGDYFMREPSKAYAWYGLIERDGKLVRKDQ